MSEHDVEKPEPDAAEQLRDVAAEEEPDNHPDEQPAALPFDANEADAAEQSREVRLDEDDYR